MKRNTNEIISAMRDHLESLGVNDVTYTINGSTLSFTYKTDKRSLLNYDELCQLKEILKMDKYPIPMGYYGEYTIYIYLPYVARAA